MTDHIPNSKYRMRRNDAYRAASKPNRRSTTVPGSCHCLEQLKLPRIERNHRSTDGWVLKLSLTCG